MVVAVCGTCRASATVTRTGLRGWVTQWAPGASFQCKEAAERTARGEKVQSDDCSKMDEAIKFALNAARS